MSQEHDFHNYRAINALVEKRTDNKYGKLRNLLIVTPHENAKIYSETDTMALSSLGKCGEYYDTQSTTTSYLSSPLINSKDTESVDFDIDDLKWTEVLQAALSGRARQYPSSHVGVIFQGIHVKPNHVYELSFSASFRHSDPSEHEQPVATYPCVEITVSNALTNWKYTIPAELTMSKSNLYATFVIPPNINFVNMEVMFSTKSFYERSKPCELLILHDACYIRPITTFMQPFQQITSSDDKLAGHGRWSGLHQWFDGIYIIHDQNTSLVNSFAFQRSLTNYGIQFHFLHQSSLDVSTRVQTIDSHEKQCNTCFYNGSLQWVDLQHTSNTEYNIPAASVVEKDATVMFPQVAYSQALKHAAICGYERVLFLSDDVVLHQDFNEYLKEYITKIPSAWKVLLLGANCLETTDLKQTGKTESAPTTRYYNADFRCANSTFAFGLSGLDTQKKFDVFLQQSYGSNALNGSTSFDLAFRNWLIQNFLNDSFILHPNVIIPSYSNTNQMALQDNSENIRRLANLQPGNKSYWNRCYYDNNTRDISNSIEHVTQPMIEMLVIFNPPRPLLKNQTAQVHFGSVKDLFTQLNILTTSVMRQTFPRWRLSIHVTMRHWDEFSDNSLFNIEERQQIAYWLSNIEKLQSLDTNGRISVLKITDTDISGAITKTLSKYGDQYCTFITICHCNTLMTTTRLTKVYEDIVRHRTKDAFVHMRASIPSQREACEPATFSWPDAFIRKSAFLSILQSNKFTNFEHIDQEIKERFKKEYVCVSEILTCEA